MKDLILVSGMEMSEQEDEGETGGEGGNLGDLMLRSRTSEVLNSRIAWAA